MIRRIGFLAWVFHPFGLAAAAALTIASIGALGSPALAQLPSTDRHVGELAAYLDHLQMGEPVSHRRLSVYPLLLDGGPTLRGRWLTMDDAISRGVLIVREKGAAGSVPHVIVENRSRDQNIFLMAGEILTGGKQTRTLRQDVILSPGQRVELSVFCVEAHRWKGSEAFSAGKLLVPQSIQQELRKGADQRGIWAEIARSNEALGAENPTGSLERAMMSKDVREKLDGVRKSIVPHIPHGAVGFVFVDRGRALGAEMFGSASLARELFPKLLDSYAVDCVIIGMEESGAGGSGHHPATEFLERVYRAGSDRAATPGSGAGIRTRAANLVGDGVSLESTLVHYGVQTQQRFVPLPKPIPRPPIVPYRE